MNPHQKNKIDINKLTEDEQKIFRLYGKVPSRGDVLQNKLKERKYFDSGDYALSKAGKASDVGVTNIGSQHPLPENIPHLSSPGPQGSNGGNANVPGNGGLNPAGANGNSFGIGGTSPVKEGGFPETQHGQAQTNTQGQGQGQGQDGREAVLSPGKEVPLRWQS